LKQFQQAFASRGFVSDSWAFLLAAAVAKDCWMPGQPITTKQQSVVISQPITASCSMPVSHTGWQLSAANKASVWL